MIYWTNIEKKIIPLVLVLIIAFSVFIWYLLKNKSNNIKRIPFIIITLLILLLELIKQILLIKNGYNFWGFPIHFCSLFLYLYPLELFTKGKIQSFSRTMILVCSIWMICMFYMHPSSIIGNATNNIFADFGMFHTFIYHHLIVLYFTLGIALNLFNTITSKSYIHVSIGFPIYALFVVPAAHLFDINFVSLLYNNFKPFDSIRISYGYGAYTFLMIAGAILGGYMIITTCLLVKRLIFKKENKTQVIYS